MATANKNYEIKKIIYWLSLYLAQLFKIFWQKKNIFYVKYTCCRPFDSSDGATALIAHPPHLLPRYCHLHGLFGDPGIQLLFTLVVRTAEISDHELQYTINLIKHYTIPVNLSTSFISINTYITT
jgi:hypothetical protein